MKRSSKLVLNFVLHLVLVCVSTFLLEMISSELAFAGLMVVMFSFIFHADMIKHS